MSEIGSWEAQRGAQGYIETLILPPASTFSPSSFLFFALLDHGHIKRDITMDHIPDEDGIRLNVKVPYICSHIHFDGQDWSTFPDRWGYPWLTAKTLAASTIETHHPHQSQKALQSFVQAWLYFGVLEVCLGKYYQRRHYIDTSDERLTVISTERLTQLHPSWFLVWMWYEILPHDPEHVLLHSINGGCSRKSRLEDLWIPNDAYNKINTLRWAESAVNIINEYSKGKGNSWAVLVLSIKLLLESLRNLFRVSFPGASVGCG